MLTPVTEWSWSSLSPAQSLPSLMLLLTTSLLSMAATQAERQLVTVMAMKAGASPSRGVYDLLMTPGAVGDASGRETLAPHRIVNSAAQFKSALLDNWANYRPKTVRMALYDNAGYLMWYLDFNQTSGAKTFVHWMTTHNLAGVAGGRFSEYKAATFVYNQTWLEVRLNGNTDARLQMAPGRFLLSAKIWYPTPPPLSQYLTTSEKTHKEMAEARLSESITAGNHPLTFIGTLSGWWVFLARTHYLVGISVRRGTSAGYLKTFTLRVSVDSGCRNPQGWQYQSLNNSGTTDPKVFSLDYTYGANTWAVVDFERLVPAYCLFIDRPVYQGNSSKQESSFFFYATENGAVDAPIFALQWFIERDQLPFNDTVCEMNLVCVTSITTEAALEAKKQEIVKELSVDTEQTSKFKRQFISAPDSRPSAQFLGAAAILFIGAVMLAVVIMDFPIIVAKVRVALRFLRQRLPATPISKPQKPLPPRGGPTRTKVTVLKMRPIPTTLASLQLKKKFGGPQKA